MNSNSIREQILSEARREIEKLKIEKAKKEEAAAEEHKKMLEIVNQLSNQIEQLLSSLNGIIYGIEYVKDKNNRHLLYHLSYKLIDVQCTILDEVIKENYHDQDIKFVPTKWGKTPGLFVQFYGQFPKNILVVQTLCIYLKKI